MGKPKFETRVKAEKKRLEAVFEEIDEKRKTAVEGLIEEAAFMRVTLEDLREDIKINGETELFSQGNQEPYLRERPNSKKYDARNAGYQKIIKMLLDELPKGKKMSGGDEFDDF